MKVNITKEDLKKNPELYLLLFKQSTSDFGLSEWMNEKKQYVYEMYVKEKNNSK